MFISFGLSLQKKMKSKINQTLLTLIVIFLFSCSSEKSTNKHAEPKSDLNKSELISIMLDKNKTEIIWQGYKTTQKIGVPGVFKEFSTNKDGQDFSNINDLVSGLEFEINSASSFSGDSSRDYNLKENFFNFLSEDFKIKGVFSEPEGDSVNITFDIFGLPKQVKFGYAISSANLIEIKGTIDLEKQFGAIKAYNAVSKKCYDLHKGSDGVSKTWKTVDVHVKAYVVEKINKD